MRNKLQDILEQGEKEFLEKFPLSFFATENWQYDYENNPSEWQFKSWQKNQENIAKTKADMIYSFIVSQQHKLLQSIVEWAESTNGATAIDIRGRRFIDLQDLKSKLLELDNRK